MKPNKSHPRKLTAEIAVRVVELVQLGATHVAIGDLYGVTKSCITRIMAGQIWRWATGLPLRRSFHPQARVRWVPPVVFAPTYSVALDDLLTEEMDAMALDWFGGDGTLDGQEAISEEIGEPAVMEIPTEQHAWLLLNRLNMLQSELLAMMESMRAAS
jgi:hypothetical protein